jgi:CRP-like cAMP-binding protein
MYMIVRGEAEVNFLNKSQFHLSKRLLLPGDYFGEISLIYNCRRTANVISSKYSTLSKLTRSSYNNITTEFP